MANRNPSPQEVEALAKELAKQDHVDWGGPQLKNAGHQADSRFLITESDREAYRERARNRLAEAAP